MKQGWKTVKIKDIVRQSKNIVKIRPAERYPLLGLSLEGRGLFLRETKQGSDISSKTLNKAMHGDFIYSRLFAWKGAFDFIRDEYNGAFISNEFPTFAINNNNMVDVKYLYFYFCQAKVWKEVETYCIGVTKASRNRFKENNFLNLSIPLPPLAEQQQIVARIESIQNRIEQIRKLRAEQEEEIKNLLYSKYINTIENAEWMPMKKVAPIVRREVKIQEDEIYPELGIRSFGKGTFHKPPLNSLEVGTKKLYKIKSGDLLFSNVFAWEGAIAVANKADDNRFGSHRFISCVTVDNLLVEFLCFHFMSPKGLEDINLCSPGGAGRNKTLGLEKLMKILVPVPKMEFQKKFVAFLEKVNQIRQAHKAQEAEFFALMPSLLNKAFKGELIEKVNKYHNTQ